MDMMKQIFVSCIMPTHNRRAFIPRAIACFQRQDYAERELLILDDGSDPIADLVPADPHIRYIRLDKPATVGEKRNLACEAAHGEIIAHWDDDDWHAPHRLRYQVDTLITSGRDLCGLNTLLFYEPASGCAWQYRYPPSAKYWLSGSTLCYRRSFWEAHPFAALNIGEDARFVWQAHAAQILVLPDPDIHIGMIHSQNTSPKQRGSYWTALPVERIRALMAGDWLAYHPEQACQMPQKEQTMLLATPPLIDVRAPATPPGMMAVAKRDDLLLREFAALNLGQALPTMRRWEIPYALFQARLENTSAVLDCTINPAGFEPLLKRLYPYTSYLHRSPVQRGEFTLPLATPDSSFDRVICINTLEHLLRSQREALIADMARKLKPGGLLILTSDYYFDSAWSNPAFLQARVMRADREEFFNGWNKITFEEWIALCAAHGLQAVREPIPEPQEDDEALYLNPPPRSHACIGGVFQKAAQAPIPDVGRRIVLSLLTWNTRAISAESLRAYIEEARMLQRLGQQPYICVVDNGSTDGTPDALRQIEPTMADIPHRIFYNERNLGNSIARNQVIDYALESGAHYLMFVDGDIEVVPFSSFAMLRYMESQGHRLGCIGANSSFQTPDRSRASASWFSIGLDTVQTTNLVAWTQYGMFRCATFEDGVRFDVNAPFDQPGWGFEDNDLAFQMDIKGYANHYFAGMTYLHRAIHSSIGLLRKENIDPEPLWKQRQQYVVNKWNTTPRIKDGPLVDVKRLVVRL